MNEIPSKMRAIALDRFGGVEALELQELPVPLPGPNEVLIRIEYAGVGEWDPFEREGGYAQLLGLEPRFPYVLGSEGAGTVALVGEQVAHLHEGDRVYSAGFLNPKGGFYAEYAAVDADLVRPIPDGLSIAQAGVMSGVALTALRGVEDVLEVRAGESVMIFGASGGIGHLAVQFAKGLGARVLAVASGEDGVQLVTRLGADSVVDGRSDDVLEAARRFAPAGLDAALLTAGGAVADGALAAIREGGRVAYPSGVHPEPQPRAGIHIHNYNGDPDRDILERVDQRIASGHFEVHIARTFNLEDAADAHRALNEHYLGKLGLQIG